MEIYQRPRPTFQRPGECTMKNFTKEENMNNAKKEYDENEKIYAEAMIFINRCLVKLVDVTVEQWLDLKYIDHRIMDINVKNEALRIEHGFKRAFMSLFGQDVDTFTRTMLLNVAQLQNHIEKWNFRMMDHDSLTHTLLEYTGIRRSTLQRYHTPTHENVKKSVAEKKKRHKDSLNSSRPE
ncbi:hypothetical protein Tco_1578325 [Tanacetum coccineum]